MMLLALNVELVEFFVLFPVFLLDVSHVLSHFALPVLRLAAVFVLASSGTAIGRYCGPTGLVTQSILFC